MTTEEATKELAEVNPYNVQLYTGPRNARAVIFGADKVWAVADLRTNVGRDQSKWWDACRGYIAADAYAPSIRGPWTVVMCKPSQL